ncbi:MAG: spore coat protein CotJB [Bacilli bacterium]|nr:spore coat protein CotJB [Bacilli bacterium]
MMNDYIDYYGYINNLNQMNNQVQNSPKSFTEPYTGFIRGNMFDKLYSNYKNYKIQELNPSNEKEYAKMLLQMYAFAAHDLGLYLDVYPNDTNAIKQRYEYVRMYNEALRQYETNYGPITKSSALLDKTPWAWDSKKWPWEGMK